MLRAQALRTSLGPESLIVNRQSKRPSINERRPRGRMNRRALPIHWFQVGAADVPKLSGRLVSNVVCHVAGVPDHHVVVADRFPVNEAVEVCFGHAAVATGVVDSVAKFWSLSRRTQKCLLRKIQTSSTRKPEAQRSAAPRLS